MKDTIFDHTTMRRGNWMQTIGGRAFYPADPRPEDVDIYDIARGLSNACRYTGQCLDFYSVAEHSVLVSRVVPPQFALEALLHDATEAYIADLNRPVKLMLPEYQELEARIARVIAARFDLPDEQSAAVKQADDEVLMAEKRVLLPVCPGDWKIKAKPAAVTIRCLLACQARSEFLSRFFELGGERFL